MKTDQLFDAAVSIWGGGTKSFKKVRKLKIGDIRLKLRLQLSLELSLMLSLLVVLKTHVATLACCTYDRDQSVMLCVIV